MRLNHVGGPDMAPHTPQRSEAPRVPRGAPRSPFRRQTLAAVLIVVLALLLSLPLVGGDYYIYIFALTFTNVILAASLRPSLTCGQLNIGHSAFMCIGAYTSALLAKNLGVPFEISLLG